MVHWSVIAQSAGHLLASKVCFSVFLLFFLCYGDFKVFVVWFRIYCNFLQLNQFYFVEVSEASRQTARCLHSFVHRRPENVQECLSWPSYLK